MKRKAVEWCAHSALINLLPPSTAGHQPTLFLCRRLIWPRSPCSRTWIPTKPPSSRASVPVVNLVALIHSHEGQADTGAGLVENRIGNMSSILLTTKGCLASCPNDLAELRLGFQGGVCVLAILVIVCFDVLVFHHRVASSHSVLSC
jgi:hypothetical protein